MGNLPTDCRIYTDSPEIKNLLKSYGWKAPHAHNFDQFKGEGGCIIVGEEIIINAPKIVNAGRIIASKGVKISAGALEGGGEIIAPSIELLHDLSDNSSEEEISEMMGFASIEKGEDFY